MNDVVEKHKIFKGDGWDIYKVNDQINVYAYHRACEANFSKRSKQHIAGGGGEFEHGVMNSWWTGDLKTKCILCDELVPDDIQALIMLYAYGKETP